MSRRRSTHRPNGHDDSLGMIFAVCLTMFATSVAAIVWVSIV
ncbi:hypothetical protein [Agromyces laixinhei]|nr:hypothetical protein [Agromyces laixinhei]